MVKGVGYGPCGCVGVVGGGVGVVGWWVCRGLGPATQLAKEYASLFQKTLRKGLLFLLSVCPRYWKKGPFLGGCQHFRKKRYFFSHFH